MIISVKLVLEECTFVFRDFCASVDDFRNEFKVPPFQDCILSFLGFSDEEKTNMEEMTKMQGRIQHNLKANIFYSLLLLITSSRICLFKKFGPGDKQLVLCMLVCLPL